MKSYLSQSCGWINKTRERVGRGQVHKLMYFGQPGCVSLVCLFLDMDLCSPCSSFC